MNHPLEGMPLWVRTLSSNGDSFEKQRERLRVAFDRFRERVSYLISNLGAELPNLTVHDVTHLDALWRVAEEIAGPGYPINPAEAFVLGGAILLHDAAHVMAAYPNGLKQIKLTDHWRDLIAQRFSGVDPIESSSEEKSAIFQVLRHLHADQASNLCSMSWEVGGEKLYLLEDSALRNYYGNLIGEIASSHHWTPQAVVDKFRDRNVAAPGFLQPASWTVDALKLAFLLRTADAAHLDDQRAPWFLFALRRPEGISKAHWKFQSRMGQPTRTNSGEILISAGAPFSAGERKAWWLAYDTAKMIDLELKSAFQLMTDAGRAPFAATSVKDIESPVSFSSHVKVDGWAPVDVAPSIGDVPRLISVLGGTGLYGDDPTAALRELLQNSLDAVRAARCLNQLATKEGKIIVSLSGQADDTWCLSIEDDGIGMSSFVMTKVLLDFGNSLWRSDALRQELPGLAASGFQAVGKFGIGFYSVFMLGSSVSVTSRRFERASSDENEQWQIIFEEGLEGRPILRVPTNDERLNKPGTKVSVSISTEKLVDMFNYSPNDGWISWRRRGRTEAGELKRKGLGFLASLVASLCPASDVDLFVKFNSSSVKRVVKSNDWLNISDENLIRRVKGSNKSLIPIRSGEGRVLGRVGLSERYSSNNRPCTIVYKGIVCGYISGLSGILLASGNNLDAKRTSVSTCGDKNDWANWALESLKNKANNDHASLMTLHTVIPNKDLPVWRFGEDYITLNKLLKKLRSINSVDVYYGDISHEGNDEVGQNNFEANFHIKEMLVVPTFEPSTYINSEYKKFPWIIGVDPIDYETKLKAVINKAWGAFDEYGDEYVIGDVQGIEITRYAWTYIRSKKL